MTSNDTNMGKKEEQQVKIAFDIACKLIPILLDGLKVEQNIQRMVDILYAMLDFNAVVYRKNEKIIAQAGNIQITHDNINEYPVFSVSIKNDRVDIGVLSFYKMPKYTINNIEKSIITGVGQLISTQLIYNSMDYYSSLRSKAELKALQAQINPHFLFNALNTISAMCRTEPLTARKLLINLSNYFRATIETSPDLVDINKELNTVLYYLEIEKARFGDRFDIEINISPNIDVKVPPLTLQPLVENAIKHGLIGSKKGKGRIVISVTKHSDCYILKVLDDGCGMDEELAHKVLRGQCGDNKIGLYNVHQRLKEVYGENNGLIIRSELGKGTEVSFNIPIRKRSKKNGAKGYYSR